MMDLLSVSVILGALVATYLRPHDGVMIICAGIGVVVGLILPLQGALFKSFFGSTPRDLATLYDPGTLAPKKVALPGMGTIGLRLVGMVRGTPVRVFISKKMKRGFRGRLKRTSMGVIFIRVEFSSEIKCIVSLRDPKIKPEEEKKSPDDFDLTRGPNGAELGEVKTDKEHIDTFFRIQASDPHHRVFSSEAFQKLMQLCFEDQAFVRLELRPDNDETRLEYTKLHLSKKLVDHLNPGLGMVRESNDSDELLKVGAMRQALMALLEVKQVLMGASVTIPVEKEDPAMNPPAIPATEPAQELSVTISHEIQKWATREKPLQEDGVFGPLPAPETAEELALDIDLTDSVEIERKKTGT